MLGTRYGPVGTRKTSN